MNIFKNWFFIDFWLPSCLSFGPKISQRKPFCFSIDEKELDKTVPAKSVVQLHCLPPETFTSSKVNVNFSPSCGSNVVNNTFTITQETAWKHSLCSCYAHGNHYSVKRKFDLGFEEACKTKTILILMSFSSVLVLKLYSKYDTAAVFSCVVSFL